MAKFEYKYFKIKDPCDSYVDVLNELGQEGWQVVAGDMNCYLLMREIP